MSDMSQLASAMLAILFAAAMLIAGQLYIKSRPDIAPFAPSSQNVRDETALLASFRTKQVLTTGELQK